MTKVLIDHSLVERTIDTLEELYLHTSSHEADESFYAAITELRAALEQSDTGIPTSVPAGWKPVARVAGTGHLGGHFDWCVPGIQGVPRGTLLYTRPHPRQPLTDEQKAAVTRELNRARCLEKRVVGNVELTDRIASAIERAHEIGSGS